MKLCWLAHNLLLLPLAGKHRIPFHSGWDCVIFVFLTLLAGKKPSNMIAGWDFYFLKFLLASSEERVFFSRESYILTQVDVEALCQRLRHRIINFAKNVCWVLLDTVLSRVYLKYLGVILDPYLSWNDHIDYIGLKISAKLGMLRKARKVIPLESFLTLNNAVKLPVFDYWAVVWYSCSMGDREYLDKPHGRAASIIEGYTVSQSQISHTFGWPTLQSRRDYLKCMLVLRAFMALLQHMYLRKLATPLISILITRAIEICSICRQLGLLVPGLFQGLPEPRSGTLFLWP